MNKKLVLLSSTALMAAGLMALATTHPVLKASAEETAAPVSIWSDGSWNPFGWGTHGISNAGITDDIAAANQANMWANHMLQFANSDYQEFEISFNAYDDTTDNVGENSDGIDIYLMTADGSAQVEMLRIWSNGWGTTNGNHPAVLYGTGWNDIGLTEAGNIVGNATSDSSFKIRVSREYGIECYDTWDKWDHASDADALAATKATLAANYGFNLVIGADGGFCRDVKVTLKSFNGQSFANDGTNFTTNEAPVITLYGDTLTAYKNIPVTLPSARAYDVLDGGQKTVAYYDGESSINQKTVFAAVGSKTIDVKATDSNGASSSSSIAVTVEETTADAFDAWLVGEHSEECHEKYATAKTIYNGMTDAAKAEFVGGTHADAVARYEAWCTANGDSSPYESTIVPAGISLAMTNDNGLWAVLSLVAVGAVAASSILLARKRKGE